MHGVRRVKHTVRICDFLCKQYFKASFLVSGIATNVTKLVAKRALCMHCKNNLLQLTVSLVLLSMHACIHCTVMSSRLKYRAQLVAGQLIHSSCPH